MDQHNQIITESPEATAKLGQALADSLSQKRGDYQAATTVCLYGSLGSGKTTFAQGFARGLGITTRLLSPTFIIVRRYDLVHTSGFLYHLDLYRVQTVSEVTALGIDEIFRDPKSFVLVEWAEKMSSILPKERTDIVFRVLSDGKHSIEMGKGSI